MNITQKDIDDLVYNFKWSKENFKNKKVTDIYRQGIYDVVELIKKKEQPFNKERLMEVAKPETPEEKAEAEERKDLRKRYERISNSDWFKKTYEGMSITIPNDLVGTDMDGGVVGEKGEQGEMPFKEYMENLKKRIEDNQLGCIVQRLDKIIELLQSAILVLPKEPYYIPSIIYKRPLDPDPNVLGGWTTTASTFKNYKKFYEPPVTFVKKK